MQDMNTLDLLVRLKVRITDRVPKSRTRAVCSPNLGGGIGHFGNFTIRWKESNENQINNRFYTKHHSKTKSTRLFFFGGGLTCLKFL